MTRQAPQLTTTHLILRGHERTDFERLAAMWGDPDIVRHIGARPSSSQESWFRLLRYMGHWPAMGYGYWAVCDKATGLYIGDVGLADHKRGLHPGLDAAPEAGWVIIPSLAGRGFATEAMAAALAWYEQTHGPTRTVCMIESVHAASIRVAEKLGYRPFADIMMTDKAVSLFERS
ncbi:hypothetical protein PbB2_02215 [Candidatus Phycosocius bacilliformis]|uniref:N-acetyltransferase domain-containing protein n=1 Tax=Candidatus Phycosocius bacilliformis TaxID=1445552 RepID=A0A2P2EBV5_9PROT|nr:GNAT family N-acetyltransferase [Candidatus Phycosocius bacilliformis]GBF58529.1 hypothetical protein PbB2_02215 [Candidatus Phycosocius bacilliformis]